MNLEKNIMVKMKEAMKAKDTEALNALRAIKSELLLVKTNGSEDALSETDEVKLLQKLVKQRNESAAMYKSQNREDLADPELMQIEVIKQFLPEQLSEEKVTEIITKIIAEIGASSMKDMGKVMGKANQEIAGRAEGQLISFVVKSLLS